MIIVSPLSEPKPEPESSRSWNFDGGFGASNKIIFINLFFSSLGWTNNEKYVLFKCIFFLFLQKYSKFLYDLGSVVSYRPRSDLQV